MHGVEWDMSICFGVGGSIWRVSAIFCLWCFIRLFLVVLCFWRVLFVLLGGVLLNFVFGGGMSKTRKSRSAHALHPRSWRAGRVAAGVVAGTPGTWKLRNAANNDSGGQLEISAAQAFTDQPTGSYSHGGRAWPADLALPDDGDDDSELLARASAVLKSQQGRRKLVPWETRPGASSSSSRQGGRSSRRGNAPQLRT